MRHPVHLVPKGPVLPPSLRMAGCAPADPTSATARAAEKMPYRKHDGFLPFIRYCNKFQPSGKDLWPARAGLLRPGIVDDQIAVHALKVNDFPARGRTPCSEHCDTTHWTTLGFVICPRAHFVPIDACLRSSEHTKAALVSSMTRSRWPLPRELRDHASEQLQYLRADADRDPAAEFGGARPVGLLRHRATSRQPELSLRALVTVR